MSVTLYTWQACSHCTEARALLQAHAVSYVEQPLDGHDELRRRLQERLGRADMPYALVDGELIGGLEELRSALSLRRG